MEKKTGENAVLWGLVGCGALLVLGLCVTLGFGVAYVAKHGLPTPPVGPGTTGVPTPTPVPVPVPDKPLPGGSVTVDARVTRVTGSLSGRVVTGCRVVVDAPSDVQAMCRAQVLCDGVLVYGGPTSGLFECRIDVPSSSVSGSDGMTTSSDGDASMTLDTPSRVLHVHDDTTGAQGEFSLDATF